MKKKYIWVIIASVLSLVLLLSGCISNQASNNTQNGIAGSSDANTTAVSNQADSITIMVSDELNPEDASPINSSTEMCLYEMVYEPLVK